MSTLAVSYWWWIALAVVVVLASIPFEIRARRRLRIYWDRRCTGIQWRRRFPSASKQQIRTFLDAFVDGFAFPRKRRLCFSPDDKLIEIYRTLYPSLHTPDALEMETFAKLLEDRYGLDVDYLPHREYTLGELFALTLHKRSNQTLQPTPSRLVSSFYMIKIVSEKAISALASRG